MATLKGVWLFNETIDFPPDSNPNSNYYPAMYGSIYFVTPGFSYNGSTREGGPEAYVTMDIYHDGTIKYIHRFWDGFEWMHNTYEQHNASKGWLSQDSRRIIFLYEQEVDDNFYDWFTSNAVEITDDVTQVDYRGRRWCALADGEGVSFSCANEIMMSDITVIAPKTEPTIAPTVADSTTPILKGVWRFKENITATQTIESSVVCKFISFDNGIYDYVSHIDVYVNDKGLRHINYYIKCTDGGSMGDSVYDADVGWYGGELYRNLYFPSECIVSQEFYDWFIANAEDITDYVTYIKMGDEIIGILRSGMTARLPCKDQVMPSNVTITAREKL